MSRKKVALSTVIAILSLGISSALLADEVPEEIQRQIETNRTKYEPGSLLTIDDFYVISNMDMGLENYDNNFLTGSLSESGEDGAYMWLITCDEKYEDIEENDFYFYTYRGITTDGSTKENVIEQYGEGVFGRFDQTVDFAYKYLTEDGAREAEMLRDDAVYYLLYNYNDMAQIAFYFNSNDDLFFIYYTTGLEISPSRGCVREVQHFLNQNGYDVGTADGKLGPNTAAAISSYKEAHGLSANGRIDDELMKCIAAEKENDESSVGGDTPQIETETEIKAMEQEASDASSESIQESPYRDDISYEELMRNPYDHLSELYTFSGTVLQLFDSTKIRLALNDNSDEQIVCSYGWLSMPSDLLEGDTVTVYGSFEGKESYTNVLNVDTEFPEFICYKMETPGGLAKPWMNNQIESVKRAEERALNNQ